MSVQVTVELTREIPRVSVHENEHCSSDAPIWYAEIWPGQHDGGTTVTFLADNIDAIEALGRAIEHAAYCIRVRQEIAREQAR